MKYYFRTVNSTTFSLECPNKMTIYNIKLLFANEFSTNVNNISFVIMPQNLEMENDRLIGIYNMMNSSYIRMNIKGSFMFPDTITNLCIEKVDVMDKMAKMTKITQQVLDFDKPMDLNISREIITPTYKPPTPNTEKDDDFVFNSTSNNISNNTSNNTSNNISNNISNNSSNNFKEDQNDNIDEESYFYNYLIKDDSGLNNFSDDILDPILKELNDDLYEDAYARLSNEYDPQQIIQSLHQANNNYEEAFNIIKNKKFIVGNEEFEFVPEGILQSPYFDEIRSRLRNNIGALDNVIQIIQLENPAVAELMIHNKDKIIQTLLPDKSV